MDEYLDLKNCSCEKQLFGKLVIACEDDLLNTTKASLVDKKSNMHKNTGFIYTISLVIVCLFLLVISVSCYYHYTRDWIKKEYEWSY